MVTTTFFRKAWDCYSQMLIKYPITTKGLTCGICITTSDVFTQHKQFIRRKSETNDDDSNNSNHSHELLQSIKLFTYGTLLLGPSLHFWFRALDRIMPSIIVNSTTIGNQTTTITLPFRKLFFLNKYITSSTTETTGGGSKKFLKMLHLDWMNKFSMDKLSWSAKRVVVEQFTYAVLVTCMYFVTTSALDLAFDSFEKEMQVQPHEEKKPFAERIQNFGKELKERMENEFKDVHQNGMKYVPIANFINFLVIPPLYRGLYFNLVGVFWNVSQWVREHLRIDLPNHNDNNNSSSSGSSISTQTVIDTRRIASESSSSIILESKSE